MTYTQYTFDLGEYTAYEIKFVGRNGAKGEKRAKRQKATPEQMSRQNQWNKEKNLRYVILANFHTGDAWTTLKYPRGTRPDADRMRADWKKFRRLMTAYYKKHGNYRADTFVFDENGKELSSYWIILGDVKPFAVMRVAEVNNIRYMDGFGYPKVYGAIPTLKEIDLCNMILSTDLEKGEKLVLTNEAIVGIDPGTGKMREKSSLLKKLFVFLGEKLPEAKSIIQEYNPQIRVDEITKSFELCLSLFSMTFGFGSKKYTFENGQIKTATEYIGERQDAMQELNKQRKEAADYITGIIRAVLWFSNTFLETSYDIDKEVCIDFDDSYVEDKTTQMSNMRADAMSFSEIPEFMIRYLMMSLNIERDEAEKILDSAQEEPDPEEED